jgi:GDP-L-fucose synthase
VFDTAKLDGTPRKLMDIGKINYLGWSSKIILRDGIIRTLEETKMMF